MKKIGCFCLFVMIALTLVGANGKGDEKLGVSDGTITVKYVGPGDTSLQEPMVLEAINRKMKEDGLNLILEVEWIGWDVWSQKVNMKMSTAEKFDLLHALDPLSNYNSMNALTVLNDYIDEYGPNIKKVTPEQCWIPLTVNEEILGLPVYWCDISDFGGPVGELYVQKNKYEPLGLTIPEDREELIPFMKTLQNNWGGNETVYAWEHQMARTPTWLHRDYPAWPFYVETENPVIFISQKGEVKSWYETEEFKMDCDYFRSLYQEGLIHPDVLSVPADTRGNMARSGKVLLGFGTCGTEAISGLQRDVDPNIWIDTFLLKPEKPYVQFDLLWNKNVVPAASEHPEAGVQLMDWLYSSEENHDLLMYGIEGKHFNYVDNNRIEKIYDDKGNSLYSFPHWQMANYKMVNFLSSDPDVYVKKMTQTNPDSELHIASGFVFDSTPVKTEYANVLAELPASIYPIRFGVVSYDEMYDDAIDSLKAAGLDVVVAEYERQFKAWLQSK